MLRHTRKLLILAAVMLGLGLSAAPQAEAGWWHRGRGYRYHGYYGHYGYPVSVPQKTMHFVMLCNGATRIRCYCYSITKCVIVLYMRYFNKLFWWFGEAHVCNIVYFPIICNYIDLFFFEDWVWNPVV